MNVEWKKEYEVGLSDVDEQHRGLFKLADDVMSANIEEAKSIALKLYQYTREHFALEEKYMAENSYPKFHEHRELHSDLIYELNKACGEPIKSEEDRDNLVKLMTNWILGHILVHDREFSEYCKTKKTT